jgi:phytoene synthase
MIEYWKINDRIIPDFEYSKSVIDYYARSFSFAARLLPEEKRWATYAVYAFCRYTDNIIDNPRNRTIDELDNEVEMLKHELLLAKKYGESEHPAISAFAISANLFDIPYDYAFDLIKGVKMDTYKVRYETFDDLYLFAYRVAAVVGLMMTHILGFKKKETLKYAEELGIAMQLTNILRDIQEDKNRGRIYIPKEDMVRFGVSENDFITEKFTENFKNLMEFEVNRTREYYKNAEKGIKDLDKDSRFSIYAAARIYGDILPKIEKVGFNPFHGRVYVPTLNKFTALLSEYFKRKG